jgi:hypothetical protein
MIDAPIRLMVMESKLLMKIFGGAAGFVDCFCLTLTVWTIERRRMEHGDRVHSRIGRRWCSGSAQYTFGGFPHAYATRGESSISNFIFGLLKCSRCLYAYSTEHVPFCIPLPTEARTATYARRASSLLESNYQKTNCFHTSEIGLIVFGKT